ncbi:MAG: hypothetical protein QOF29_940, partial [bacterium]
MATSRSSEAGVGVGALALARPAWPVLLAGALAALGVVTVLDGLLYDRVGIGIATLALLPVLVTAITALGPPRRAAGLGVLCGLIVLWLWSLLSAGWSPLPDEAHTTAERWLLYTVLFALAASLFRRRPAAIGFAVTFIVAVAIFEIGVLIASVAGAGGGLYLEGRLNSPVGYINGEAAMFAAGFWPAVALVAHGRRRWAVPAGAMGAASLALLCLTQSRAGLGSLLLAAVVVLAALPGRVRFGAALAAVALPVLPALPTLLAVSDKAQDNGGAVADATATGAALMVLACAVAGAALAFAASVLLARRRTPRPGPDPRVVRRTALAALLLAVVAAGVAHGPISDFVGDRWNQFKTVQDDSGGGGRLTSLGGARYDYWRIASDVFSDHPFKGVGAGGYQVPYLRDRKTDQVVRQPHSLPLQVAAETGLVGLLALLVVAGGALGAGIRAARWVRARERDRWLVTAAAGMLLGWTVHTSSDWLHLLPGLVAAMLAALALLNAVDGWDSTGADALPPVVPRRRPLIALGVLGAALVAFGAASVARITIADLYRKSARAALDHSPGTALSRARQALSLNPDDESAHYVVASAWALRDDYPRARAALLDARGGAPDDYVTYVLLGDLAARRGDVAEARRQYEAALERNPRDP